MQSETVSTRHWSLAASVGSKGWSWRIWVVFNSSVRI